MRTDQPADRLPAEDAGRSFRCLKTVDLRIRPIHHRIEKRVRAHLFLYVLAYYIEWNLRRALALLLFQDERLD